MINKLTVFVVCWAATMLIAAGCSNQPAPLATQSDSRPLSSLTEAQERQKQVGLATRDKLFNSLLVELMKSMSTNGVAKSINVCKSRAPEIAASVKDETGVRIGRTSFKLRNPGNSAPDWAVQFVADRVENDIAIELPDKSLGMLLPIRLQTTCVLCHGNDAQVMPDVKAAIVSNYPNDQATGFAEGDLRGYFWIEVPSSETLN